MRICSWNTQFAEQDEGLSIDGKTMRSAIDDKGDQTHIMGVVGHESGRCYTKKKSEACRQKAVMN